MSLQVDKLGSAGKLVMRYRTVFAAFPLLVVLIVLRKQFKVYDVTGVFMSFSESMDVCLRTSLPFIFIALTCLAISLSKDAQGSWTRSWLSLLTVNTQKSIDYNVNDLMLGTQDPFFWFLVPLFGIISVGVCIAGNYLITILLHVFAFVYGRVRALWRQQDDNRYVQEELGCNVDYANHWSSRAPELFASNGWQRTITVTMLLLLVTTIIPYQFAYIVLALVQLFTCVRALRLARDTQSGNHLNFYNYTHTMLVLMLWVLPINMPVLIVWIHNLSVHWLTPFSTHHNLLAVLPLVLAVETMSTGNMAPRVPGRVRYITNVLTFLSSLYAAVYGVTYAYRLHHLLNLLAAWLFALHLWQGGGVSLSHLAPAAQGTASTTVGVEVVGKDVKKRP